MILILLVSATAASASVAILVTRHFSQTMREVRRQHAFDGMLAQGVFPLGENPMRGVRVTWAEEFDDRADDT